MICTTCRTALRMRMPLAAIYRSSATTTHTTATITRASPLASSTTIPRLLSIISSPYTSPLRPFSTTTSLKSDPPTGNIDPETPSMDPAESAIAALLQEKLSPTDLLVRDVSGGCGSMYAIEIASAQFKGQTMLKQQRMVNAALGDLVKGWHGVQIRTRVPEDA